VIYLLPWSLVLLLHESHSTVGTPQSSTVRPTEVTIPPAVTKCALYCVYCLLHAVEACMWCVMLPGCSVAWL